MASPSSSSRRWADYTDDEEDEAPRRTYCEVLRSGSPSSTSGSRATSSSPPLAPSGVGSPKDLAPSGVVSSRAPAAAARPWAVDDGVRRLASLVVHGRQSPPRGAGAAPPGARPWTAARGRKRPRGQHATLPAWSIRAGLPSNLAGACFNCTRTCHISAECTYETVCLRCGEEGHHARACPQGRRMAADRRGDQGRAVAPGGPAVQQRSGARVDLEDRGGQGRGSAAAVDLTQGPARASVEDRGKGVASDPDAGEPLRERYKIPARQRLGLGAPSPPVDVDAQRIPVHMRLGEHGRRCYHPILAKSGVGP
ncbi:hypothetical protein QYE76_071582 [Lolium multiflorum]|uniref:CCHC-type domain-containing protein n=1 Tax=Lolium multiflorum TaxID=4521 RepID=A0AAD8WGY7_LOLMU|nr:hypothetical protein QYE76_071582 [Lolium multiflorum]